MKTKLSKTQAKERIESFFNLDKFTSQDTKKIKRLAMKFNIKLGEKRAHFCKKCLSHLEGKTRISKTHKTVQCKNCGYVNKFKIN